MCVSCFIILKSDMAVKKLSEFKWFSVHRSNQVHFQSSKKSNKLAFKNDILEAAKKILSRLCE